MTTILFDLDGTIINSFLGITRCVQYALRSKGIDVENLKDLEEYIGPPLKPVSYTHLTLPTNSLV